MRLNPIEFYEGYVISTTFAFTSQVDRSFLYPSSNRDFYLAIHLVTVAANDQGKKLCRALSPSIDLSSSVIQPIIPENTKIITYIPHNFALWQKFPSIYRLVGARLKNLSLVDDESTRAEYLSLTGRVRGPALFFATHAKFHGVSFAERYYEFRDNAKYNYFATHFREFPRNFRGRVQRVQLRLMEKLVEFPRRGGRLPSSLLWI